MSLVLVEDLRKSFRAPGGGDHRVIDVPRFALEAEEQVGIEGASGSGKSTFLNLLAGILRADSGRIVLHGEELTAMDEPRRDRFRARHLGYVFQTMNLLQGMTALENVLLGMMFGPGPDAARAAALLERLGLGERMHHRPHQLSLGQQQRVAVARAVANGPSLVLADEPTGSLDRRHARAALDLLQEVCREQKAALLVVSHDEGVLASFGRTLAFAEINRAAREEDGDA